MRSRLLGLGFPLLLFACDIPDAPPRPKPEAQPVKPPEPKPPAPASPEPPAPPPLVDGSVVAPAGPKPPRPPVPAEVAPNASPRLDGLPPVEQLRTRIDSYFQGHAGRRLHVQTDKPLYKPGETIWVKVWDLTTRAFAGSTKSPGMHVELISPRGAQVLKKKVHEQAGMSQLDFELPAGIAGGEYTLRVRTLDGQKTDRPVVVSSYEAPRLKMKMEFVRKAYGAGDEVTATIEVKRPTGEPLRNQTLSAMVRLDGADLPKVQLTTDAQGEGLVRFNLPAEIALGDGLLTVLCDEGGLTESIARRVPIVLKKLALSAYPEGGSLVNGLPGRVYFEAKNPLGKPADVAGHVVDDTGAEVAKFTSVRDGLGRFELTPQVGRSYRIAIDKPVGITDLYPVPPAEPEGCVLRSFDDLDGQLSATRVSVSCSSPRRVVVTAVVRENILDAAAVDVPAGAPAVVYLEPRGQATGALGAIQGVARVTLYDESLSPMAERLVYRQRRSRLGVKVTPDKKTYVPRDKVQLEIATTDSRGNPVPADLALSVADDTVLSFADDKTGHMLSRLYLEPELPGKVEEPNFYFDLSEEKSGMAMELLMGTRGYRRFEWMPGLLPARPNRYIATRGTGASTKATEAPLPQEKNEKNEKNEKSEKSEKSKAQDLEQPALGKLAKADNKPQEAVRHKAPPRPDDDALALAPRDEKMPERKAKKEVAFEPPAPPPKPAKAAMGPMPATPPAAPPPAPMAAQAAPMPAPAAEMAAAKPRLNAGDRLDNIDKDDALGAVAKRGGGAGRMVGVDGLVAPGEMAIPMPVQIARPPVRRKPAEPWSVVRVFPTPAYQPGYSGPRNDFRETVAWQPQVQTGADGKTTVSFFLSDAVSSFRVVTEGVGGGAAGRDETVVKSSLPFSLAVKLPLEVSEGDHIKLPLVLSNEYSQPMLVKLDARFGSLVSLDKPVERTSGELAASARETLYYPLTVTGKRGATEVRFLADGAGLRDEVTREIQVSPRGFPQHISKSGRLRESWSQELTLAAALPGTADGQVRVYPSLVSNLVASLEGMLREPVGCFEQASSANYPNIMILKALREEGIQDPRLTGRAYKLLDEGYRRLTGYETPQRGYEWFGSAPGHEALSAYGLLEFTDMRAVFHDVDRQMITRTADWLMSRRDGKGGYLRDSKALDSFGSAAKAVTDAYITYSLTEAKQPGLGPELDSAAYLAQNSSDAYLLALSAGALLNSGRRQPGQAAVRRLVALQESDGGFKKADHSITRSGGENLQIETTSLAILAMLKAGGNEAQADRAVEWLLGHRRGMGSFGSTQATVLGLKALVAYMGSQGHERQGGSVVLSINGRLIATRPYDVGAREPLVFSGLSQYLKEGANRVELRHTGRLALPFSVAVDYRSLQPANSSQAQIGIATTLERAAMKLGESVRMRVVLTNKSDHGQPMTLARVQLPGGLTFQSWQLKELREKGLVAFYETRPREVNLYLREMKPRQELEIPLDLVAYAAGDYTAQASSAYLYYTDEHKSWVAGTQVAIEP